MVNAEYECFMLHHDAGEKVQPCGAAMHAIKARHIRVLLNHERIKGHTIEQVKLGEGIACRGLVVKHR
jgi:hypothetical protein